MEETVRVKIWNYILSDILIIALVYFIPTISHFLPFPIYLLDPMRFFVLIGFLITGQKNNALLLSITVPLFSHLVTGHPIFIKSFLIAAELSINILVFIYLIKEKKLNVLFAILLSILISKISYYLIKFLFLQFGLIEGGLFSTSFVFQLESTLIVALLFSCSNWLKVNYSK